MAASTVSAVTATAWPAADLCFNVECGGVGFLIADDDFACTFLPPNFACPMASFVATVTDTCTVNARACSNCADPATANYSLAVTLDAVNTIVDLTADDQP